jgi:hypothetical protein
LKKLAEEPDALPGRKQEARNFKRKIPAKMTEKPRRQKQYLAQNHKNKVVQNRQKAGTAIGGFDEN